MILRALMLCLVCTACAALHGVEFPDTRIEFGQSDGDPTADDGSEPQIDIKTPWGLWANRGPYPYYDGPFGIDTQDDLVARDIWFDFHNEIWLTPNGWRGVSGGMRARMGLFLVDVSFTQLARTDRHSYFGSRKVKDWAGVTDARGHIGLTLPVWQFGYVDFAIGLAGFDETRGISRLGPSYRASASIYPIWPLEVEGYVSRAQFFDGTGVNEFGVRLHVQVFRHLLITGGWRWMNVDGSNFSTQGFTLGFSFQFGNLRTFFWSPFRGPAY
ncbi:MAG: hypothetical protein KDB68_01140 [Planctomycetes bacterium]|nr:hypothetical protein [Planctomycetota bacterium]